MNNEYHEICHQKVITKLEVYACRHTQTQDMWTDTHRQTHAHTTSATVMHEMSENRENV